MGQWLDRLQRKSAGPLGEATDKTDRTPLLAVLAVPPSRGAAILLTVALVAEGKAVTEAAVESFSFRASSCNCRTKLAGFFES